MIFVLQINDWKIIKQNNLQSYYVITFYLRQIKK